MATITCIHIVPGLPPQNDEVGRYALNLAFHLQQLHGVQSRFIVCDPEWNGPGRVEGFVVRRLRLRAEAGIWSILATAKEKESAVLLHYDSHAYGKRGVPFWLYRGIKSWIEEQTACSAPGQRQLCTMFHERWESCARPWKSEFYLRILQTALVKGFHLRSRLSIASTHRVHQMLEAFAAHKTLLLPNPSSVPVRDRSLGERYADWSVIAEQYHQAMFDVGCLNRRERPNLAETSLHTGGVCAHQTV